MALLMALVRPVTSAISASRREPAWAATPLPSGVTFNAGKSLANLHPGKCPSHLVLGGFAAPSFPNRRGISAHRRGWSASLSEMSGLGGPQAVGQNGIHAPTDVSCGRVSGPSASSCRRVAQDRKGRPPPLASVLHDHFAAHSQHFIVGSANGQCVPCISPILLRQHKDLVRVGTRLWLWSLRTSRLGPAACTAIPQRPGLTVR